MEGERFEQTLRVAGYPCYPFRGAEPAVGEIGDSRATLRYALAPISDGLAREPCSEALCDERGLSTLVQAVRALLFPV